MKRFKKVLILLLIVCISVFGYVGYTIYHIFFAASVDTNVPFLYVQTGSNIENLYRNIEQNHIVADFEVFKVAADKMKLEQKIHAGRYELKKGMSNRTLINLIKSGNQKPMNLKIHNIRTLPEFTRFVSAQLECDSNALHQYIWNDFLPKHPEFTKDNIYTLFIPNSYQIYWDTSASEFVEKMYKEYQKFWKYRIQQAKDLRLSPQQVTVLASIVDSEALFDKEMPRIAGLYLNRLQKGIKLQADPTVIFAHQDFTIRRVTNKLLDLASPYNTYYVKGLPPGPIMMPSINAIDAVLKHEKNNYIYMCAKEDFSGYHNFATTQTEHLKNAKLFQQALNKRQIFK